MTQKKHSVDVTIMGRAYKFACSDEEKESLLSAASLLDRKMNEIKSTGKVASAERIAVMAAINFANELIGNRSDSAAFDLEPYRRRISAINQMLDTTLDPQEKLL